MPIPKIQQPDILIIDDTLRLRKYDGNFDFAWGWYQDKETLLLVDGDTRPFDQKRLEKMYTYLDTHGELYFIEAMQNGTYVPIGDVTFSQQDMPIVIGDKQFRAKGIGRRVIAALVTRAKQLGYSYLLIDEIYDYNIGSRKMFESVGFYSFEAKGKGHRYRLDLADTAN